MQQAESSKIAMYR